MTDEIEAHRRRAEQTIRTTWKQLAGTRTLGWAAPVALVARDYPFVRDAVHHLGARVTPEFPVWIYQSRETPPLEMEVAIAYGHEGNPFTTRLVSSRALPCERALLLNEFSQALWVSVAQRMLPPPEESQAFMDALAHSTGSTLFSISLN